jgi:hypothetical protein
MFQPSLRDDVFDPSEIPALKGRAKFSRRYAANTESEPTTFAAKHSDPLILKTNVPCVPVRHFLAIV